VRFNQPDTDYGDGHGAMGADLQRVFQSMYVWRLISKADSFVAVAMVVAPTSRHSLTGSDRCHFGVASWLVAASLDNQHVLRPGVEVDPRDSQAKSW
jgi:hypothetical protein